MWPQAGHVAKGDIELVVVLPLPLNSGITGVHYHA